MRLNERRVLLALTLLLAAFAVIKPAAAARSLSLSRSSLDLHQILWVPGHFLWQGMDPYQAFLADRVPPLPYAYWDGPVVTEGPITQPGWSIGVPSNTAPIVLLTAPLARLSWPLATRLWFLLTLACAPLLVLAVLRLTGLRPRSLQGALLFALCFAIGGTWDAVFLGQTALPLAAAMFGALALRSSRPVLAGVLLGLSLSKYSLAFPAFLLFAWERSYKGLLAAIGVQVAGALAISAIGGTPPHEAVLNYFRIMGQHVAFRGRSLPNGLLYGLPAAAKMTLLGLLLLALLGALLLWYRARRRSASGPLGPRDSLVLFCAVCFTNLLFTYHHRHDWISTILLFVALVIAWGDEAGPLLLSAPQRRLLGGLTLLCGVGWLLPLHQVLGESASLAVFTVCTLVALVLSVLLLFRLEPDRAGALHAGT